MKLISSHTLNTELLLFPDQTVIIHDYCKFPGINQSFVWTWKIKSSFKKLLNNEKRCITLSCVLLNIKRALVYNRVVERKGGRAKNG